jgi:hypothetical protein
MCYSKESLILRLWSDVLVLYVAEHFSILNMKKSHQRASATQEHCRDVTILKSVGFNKRVSLLDSRSVMYCFSNLVFPVQYGEDL